MLKPMLLTLAFVLATLCGSLRAGAPCCDGCGCQPCTRKVCRLVCDTKKVPTPVYSVVCEDFCLPGPSVKCKVPCCCPEGCHSGCHNGYKIVWKPTCGKVHTRANLVVGKTEKEVPSYKCVVEEVCTRCGHCAHRTTYPSAADPTTAVAMAGEEGTNAIADPGVPSPAQTADAEVVEATEAVADKSVASKSLVDRMFTRR
jgi:hypothetical protein